jgi:hypothetical protein
MVMTSQRSEVVLEWNRWRLSAGDQCFRHLIELHNDCGSQLGEANGCLLWCVSRSKLSLPMWLYVCVIDYLKWSHTLGVPNSPISPATSRNVTSASAIQTPSIITTVHVTI